MPHSLSPPYSLLVCWGFFVVVLFGVFLKEKSKISSDSWRRSCILLPAGTGLHVPGKQSQSLPVREARAAER